MSAKQKLIQVLFRCSEILSSLTERLSRPVRPSDIVILSAWTPEIAGYGEITARSKQHYAERHGYTFQAVTGGFEPSRPPAWSKIIFIRQALKNHRLVFWSDADSMIMNHDLRLESLLRPGTDIHLTRCKTPYPHVNTGNMFLRRSWFTDLFLSAVWNLKAFINDPSWEQASLNYLIKHYSFNRVTVSPNRLFNSFGEVPDDPDPWQPGDFMIHFPGVPDKETKIKSYAERTA